MWSVNYLVARSAVDVVAPHALAFGRWLIAFLLLAAMTWREIAAHPIALRRVERLFCKNERAVLELDLGQGRSLLLVAVAAILVASIRLHCLPQPLKLTYRGPNRLPCGVELFKGEGLGYFEHGSTIIVIGSRRLTLAGGIREGESIDMGRALLRRL